MFNVKCNNITFNLYNIYYLQDYFILLQVFWDNNDTSVRNAFGRNEKIFISLRGTWLTYPYDGFRDFR